MFKVITVDDLVRPTRRISRIFIHCTAVDTPKPRLGTALVKATDDFHRNGRGWTEVGYHFMIDKAGTLITARDIEKVPAAQAGYNTGSLAICLDGEKLSLFTQAQLDTLTAFCTKYNHLYKGNVEFWPHNKVSTKTCPVVDVYKLLGINKVSGHIPL